MTIVVEEQSAFTVVLGAGNTGYINALPVTIGVPLWNLRMALMELSTVTIVGVEMRKWTEEIPQKEGWYFWRSKRHSDPWLYQAIYVFPVNEKENLGPEYFESGTLIDKPKGGLWSNRITT